MIVDFFRKNNRCKDIVLYCCTSSYPCPTNETFLLEIKKMKKKYGGLIKDYGYSGHHEGIVLDNVAYAFGAKYIERHFTLNKNLKGTDHSFSLVPKELKKLRDNINDTYYSLKFKSNKMSNNDFKNRKKFDKKITF